MSRGTRPATMDFDPVTQPELFGTDNKKSTIYTVNFVLLTFATILVALRFYTRFYILNLVGADDWLVLLSLVFFAALVACELLRTSRRWLRSRSGDWRADGQRLLTGSTVDE